MVSDVRPADRERYAGTREEVREVFCYLALFLWLFEKTSAQLPRLSTQQAEALASNREQYDRQGT